MATETASQLITKALRLINVPGRGALLDAQDQADALDALKDIVNSQSVSKQFTPGIRRHFWDMVDGQSIYTYGPGGQLDTNSFDDLAPIRIEDGYIRSGSTITDNEDVQNHEFLASTGWTITAGVTISNGRATFADAGKLEQNLSMVTNTTYVIKAWVTIETGDVVLRIMQDAAALLEQTLDASGLYEFQVTFTGTTSEIELETASVGDDLYFDKVSVLPANTDRFTLPDAQGSDFHLSILDQLTYNGRFSKGTGGRPYQILYTQDYPVGELRLDNAAVSGDIMVLDVLVNRSVLTNLTSEIKLPEHSRRWLKYQLADDMSGEYGKQLSPRQITIKNEAYDLMASGTRRLNMLRVDRGMRKRPAFDINRGDP